MTDTNLPAAAPAALPAVYDYDEYAGAGFEGASKSDFMTPILDILDGKSKDLNNYPDARPGWMIIRAIGEVFDGQVGVPIVPVCREKIFMRWRSRDAGGGIVAQLPGDDKMALEEKEKRPFGKIVLANGDELVETFVLLSLLLRGDDFMRLAIPFTSTKITAYRNLLTKANDILVPGKIRRPDGSVVDGKITPPLFSHRYRLKTKKRNKADYQWYIYDQIGFDGATALDARIDPKSALFEAAVNFRAQQMKGEVKVDTRGMERGDEDEHAAGGGAGGPDDPPF